MSSKSKTPKEKDVPPKFNSNFKIPVKRQAETISELAGSNSFTPQLTIAKVESLDIEALNWKDDVAVGNEPVDGEQHNRSFDDDQATDEIELGEYKMDEIPLPPVIRPILHETTVASGYDQNQAYTYVTESYYGDGVSTYHTTPYHTTSVPPPMVFDNFPKLQMDPVYQSPMFNLDETYITPNNIHRAAVPVKDQVAAKKRKLLDSVIDYYMEDTYPDELKKLMKPLVCDLCDSKMNSCVSSKMHYQSKIHEKKISAWLETWFAKTGERIERKRIRTFPTVEGPSGPDAFHCKICDLKLTSVPHANQHYMGKKHRMAAAGRKNPAGCGYWNEQGVWIRQSTNITTDSRFGIGSSFVEQPVAEMPAVGVTSPSAVATPQLDEKVSSSTSQPAAVVEQHPDPSKFCSICLVTVTSDSQMKMHLEGIKHAKKLKLMGSAPFVQPNDTILASVVKPPHFSANSSRGGGVRDISIYRTPSGQFYCGTCDLTVLTENLLIQHLDSKKHMKTLKNPTASS